MKKFKRMMCVGAAISLAACSTLTLFGCSAESDVITLRVANWEEYIDLGDWGEDEFIDIDNEYSEDGGVFGENSMVDDFVEWFNANHDYEV